MIIKEAKYKKVRVMQTRLVSDSVYGCDQCRKEIPEFPNEASRLELTIFNQDNESIREHFCSWKCVLKRLTTIESNYFVSLPFVYFDDRKGRRGADSLIKLIKKIV